VFVHLRVHEVFYYGGRFKEVALGVRILKARHLQRAKEKVE